MQERIEKTAEYVKNYLYEVAEKRDSPYANPGYRYQHTLRVANIGKQLAEAEGANVEHVVMGCLLHDLAVFDDLENVLDHGRLAARICRPFLAGLDYSDEEVNDICYTIAVHVDGEADFEHEPTLEASCVSDADNIDRFDALRILHYCEPEVYDFNALVAKLTDRLKVLRDYRSKRVMETEAGHHWFNRQLDRQIEFYETILAQDKMTRLPEIE